MEGTITESGNPLLNSEHTIKEDLNWAYVSFTKWLKGFATWDNFFRLLGVLLILFALMAVYKLVVRSIRKIPEKKTSRPPRGNNSKIRQVRLLRGLDNVHFEFVRNKA